jgi:hypothetical protein
MSGDVCNSKKIEVEVQENGIVRDLDGWIIGRLDLGDDYPFRDLAVTCEPKRRLRDEPQYIPLIVGAAACVALILGMALGHNTAMDQPCAARCQIPESIR